MIYRGGDGNVHELWWTYRQLGPRGPHERGRPPGASHVGLQLGDPAAYTADVDGTQHVVYRGGDGNIHELWWT